MGVLSNDEILANLESAFKAITVGDLNEGILQPEKFAAFIQTMQARTVILQESRYQEMDAQQVDIDRVGFVGRILKAGLDSDGATRDLGTDEHVKPSFATNKLVAKEVQAITGIKDQALRRNIERGGFENTLINLFGEAAGRDMEEWFLLADTDISWNTDAVLSLTDGWAKRAVNKIYGGGDDKDFDPANSAYPEVMFQAMLDAIPKQYFQDPTEWRIYADWGIVDAYLNLLKARGTALGDRAWTEAMQVSYKGVPVRYVPMLGRSGSTAQGGAGAMAMLQHPDNMVWGVFHEVTIERDRIPKSRQTDFVLTLEADCNYEDENAAVVAFIDQTEGT